eukprot:scaffold256999_cov28-Prasinocladus_malaysianus.AAC.1
MMLRAPQVGDVCVCSPGGAAPAVPGPAGARGAKRTAAADLAGGLVPAGAVAGQPQDGGLRPPTRGAAE